MRKAICFVLCFLIMFTACSGWEVEINNPKEESQNPDSFYSEENSEPEQKNESKPETMIPEEPEVESFDRMLVYNDDYNTEYAKLSEKELDEWLAVIKPEEWKEDSAEKEGGHLSDECIILGGTNAAMYVGIDYTGDEIALIRWGGIYSKSYIIPQGTFEQAKAFEERIKREQPTVFGYPECNYDMSAEAFLGGENDEYIKWLVEILECLNWTAATGLDSTQDYAGYATGAELNSKQLYNCFMFIFDENNGAQGSNRTNKQWYNEEDGKYHIPLTDINAVLQKYFSGYSFDYTEITANYEYDEDIDGIIIPGGYGINGYMGEPMEVVSIKDGGDGTIKAVVERYVYHHMDEEGNMILSEKPGIRYTMVLRPYENGCVCESLKIKGID